MRVVCVCVRSGLVAAACVFILFSVLQMRDGLFVRPHKAFWRAMMGVAVLYLVALVFLLFQVRTL
jgi:phosphatidylserine synthase 2